MTECDGCKDDLTDYAQDVCFECIDIVSRPNWTPNLEIQELIDQAERRGLEAGLNSIMISDEEMREPIQDALYATGRLLTTQATDLAVGIIQYINDAGYTIVRKEVTK